MRQNIERVPMQTLIELLQDDPDDRDIREMVSKRLENLDFNEYRDALIEIGNIIYEYDPDIDYEEGYDNLASNIMFYPKTGNVKIVATGPEARVYLELSPTNDNWTEYESVSTSGDSQESEESSINELFLTIGIIIPNFPLNLIGLSFDKSTANIKEMNSILVLLSEHAMRHQRIHEFFPESVAHNLNLGFYLADILKGDKTPLINKALSISREVFGDDLVRQVTEDEREYFMEEALSITCPNCFGKAWSEIVRYAFQCPECGQVFMHDDMGFVLEILKGRGLINEHGDVVGNIKVISKNIYDLILKTKVKEAALIVKNQLNSGLIADAILTVANIMARQRYGEDPTLEEVNRMSMSVINKVFSQKAPKHTPKRKKKRK